MGTLGLAIVLAAALALPATASTQDQPSVLCWNKDFPPPTGDTGPVVKVEPKKCYFFKKGEADAAGGVNVKALTWKSWGQSKTTGKGKVRIPMTDDVVKVTVKLSKIVGSTGRAP